MNANLVTQADYARLVGVPLSTITSRVKAETIDTVEIGGVKFIDKGKYPPEKFEKTKGGRPKKAKPAEG